MIAQPDFFPETIPPDDSDERYTPWPFIHRIEREHGFLFDLDVAATAKSAKARRFYTKADNGLVMPWVGHCWCNPPFSDIEPWVIKAWREMRDPATKTVTMLLPSWTDRKWWHRHVEPFRDWKSLADHQRPAPEVVLYTEFLERMPFGNEGNPDAVGVPNGADFWCVLLRWRR